MQSNISSIIFEMVIMLPLVWLILFFSRSKLFPKALSQEERSKKTVTPLIISALCIGVFGRALTGGSTPVDLENPKIFLFLFLMSQASSFLMIFGSANLSYKKGYHWGWGFLGVFSLIGLAIIALLKPKSNPK